MCHFLPVYYLGIVFLGRVEGQNITPIVSRGSQFCRYLAMMSCCERKNWAERREGKGRRKLNYGSLFGYRMWGDKVSTMAYPTYLEDLTFEKISKIIRSFMRPTKKLVEAERTKFMSMIKEIDEPIIKYLHRLRNASLKPPPKKKQTIEEDLIQLRLIKGIYNASHRYKINKLEICL